MLIGLVGKPSAGKSTFFSSSTLVEVETALYPFTTIKPNRGIGYVRVLDAAKDFGVQSNPRTGYCINDQRFVPVELLDVAGLVPGAHEGKGLGNQFLDDLRQADVLIHIIDASGSTNEKGEPVAASSHDPAKDVLFLEEEINLWFFGILKKNWSKVSKIPTDSKSKKVDLIGQALSGLGIKSFQMEKAFMNKDFVEKQLRDWSDDEIKEFTVSLREIAKPIIIAANKIDVGKSKENFVKLKERFSDKKIIGCSSASELTLKKAAKQGLINYIPGDNDFEIIGELNEKQKAGLELIKEKVLKENNGTGVQTIINQAVFDLLGYIAIFPGGTKGLADSQGRILPDCFLMPPNSTALDFAFRLHTDFGNNFIKAIDVRTKKLVGKEYELKNCDVIEIVYNK